MYISGTQYDFENRFHALPISGSDFATGFSIEYSGYLKSLIIDSGVFNRWTKEIIKKEIIFNQTGFFQGY